MKEELYPIGQQYFPGIIKENKVYVDKTDLIYKLVKEGKYYFLSRPRRFGKSLLLSTIQTYFEGDKEIFKNLAIYDLEKDWKKHIVFHLELSRYDPSNPNSLTDLINNQLDFWEKQFKLPSSRYSAAQRFANLIREGFNHSGKGVVILVDEYDNPLINAMDNPELYKENRDFLKSIYTNLKALDECIAFAMLTGVSRFSQMSVFSGINNLNDISLDPEYSSICGITQQELESNFHLGIESLAKKEYISKEEAIELLKKNYDGYHFTKDSPDIYNPFSLLNAFRKKEIGSYWYATGTPAFLIESLYEKNVDLSVYLNEEVPSAQLSALDTQTTSPLALLFQTGYLTIKDYDRDFDLYHLGIPNREVKQGLMFGLSRKFQERDESQTIGMLKRMVMSLRNGKAKEFMIHLQSYFSSIPNNITRNVSELYFENNCYILLNLIGLYCHAEYQTSDGRIDLLIRTDKFIYIMELKMDSTAQVALQQINDKNYSYPFVRENKEIFKIGVNFSSQTRNITDWIIES